MFQWQILTHCTICKENLWFLIKYNKENYDRLNIQVPKGQKAEIEKHWKAKGYKSLNAYANELIRKDMQGEATEEHNTES